MAQAVSDSLKTLEIGRPEEETKRCIWFKHAYISISWLPRKQEMAYGKCSSLIFSVDRRLENVGNVVYQNE